MLRCCRRTPLRAVLSSVLPSSFAPFIRRILRRCRPGDLHLLGTKLDEVHRRRGRGPHRLELRRVVLRREHGVDLVEAVGERAGHVLLRGEAVVGPHARGEVFLAELGDLAEISNGGVVVGKERERERESGKGVREREREREGERKRERKKKKEKKKKNLLLTHLPPCPSKTPKTPSGAASETSARCASSIVRRQPCVWVLVGR